MQKFFNKMKGVKNGNDEYKELERKNEYLGLYRDALNTMHTAIDKLTFTGTESLYVNYDQMIERLYILLKHRKGGNDSELLKNEANDIKDILLKNNIISQTQHKKIYSEIF